MPVTEQITVEEYLSTDYSPDCDFVDGVLEDRHVGEKDHSKLQIVLGAWFYARRKELGIEAFSEQRVQISPSRYRLPDICVTLGEPEGQIFNTPPFLCIEILSRGDTLSQMWEKVGEYFAMGVPVCWIIDPRTGQAFHATPGNWTEVTDGILRAEGFEMPLADVLE